MPKINTLLPKEQAQKLVNLSKDLKINDQVVFAKPIIRNNEIVFFYKKRYYTTKELLNTVIKYNAYKNEV